MRDAVRLEIEQAHRALVAWVTGAVERTAQEFERLFLLRFDRELRLIQPAGVVLEMREFAAGLERSHGSNPRFRIAIRDVTVVREHADLVVATYTEWQRNAARSTPPDNGRIASAWVRREPAGWRWLHVHETWLPPDVMAAGPYDF